MNFYYDPILGLQYTYLGNIFLINIDAIPQFDREHWLELSMKTGVQLLKHPAVEQILNITDYKI